MTIKELISSKAFQLGVISGISGAISAFISYQVTKKRLNKEYREIIDREIIEARNFYSRLNKRDAFSSPSLTMKEVGLEEAVHALKQYKGTEEIEVNSNSVYMGGKDSEEDPIEELRPIRELSPLSKTNDRMIPYVITVEEFMEASYEERTQVTLTYYSEDDILTDDKDLPIDDVAYTVGIENLTQFGNGSQDSRIVYIRNERIDVDFEVILDKGSFAETVHGIKREPRRKTPRFRGDHE